MISRFEKIVLIILCGLGAGYWGIGLGLYLLIPGEAKFWLGIQGGIGVGLFLLYQVAVLKNRIRGRLAAWTLFFAVLALAVGSLYIIEALFQPTTVRSR
ncbi:MAG: hypothetical protein IBX61_02340 [Thermoleophilia bacterium]|nr:hypothetical protein [Thermoleophilia bacterium]